MRLLPAGDDPGRIPDGGTALSFCKKGGYMVWFLLVLAGLFETGWAIGLKYTHGFTRLWPSLGTIAAMAVSFALLAHAMKTLPVGTAYAVWTGIGTVGAVIAGVFLFHEAVSLPRLLFLAMILGGIAGLKWFS